MGAAASLDFFKAASTMFLGIGITTVLDKKLMTADAAAKASRAGIRRWTKIDAAVSCFMLGLVALGEVSAVRVVAATGERRTELAADAQPIVIALLAITALYTVVQFVAARALEVAWERKAGERARCTSDERSVVGWALVGLSVGAVAFAVLAPRHPTLGLGQTSTPSLAACAIFAVAAICVLSLRRGNSSADLAATRTAEEIAAEAHGDTAAAGAAG